MSNTYSLPTDPADCAGGVVAPGIPCASHNLAVQIIDSKIYRMTQELTQCVSSRVTAIGADDKARIDAAFDDLYRVIDIAADTVTDSHGLLNWTLTDLEAVQMPVENEAINSATSYMMLGDYGLRISQSARINDGILADDKADLVGAMQKAQNGINDFFDNSNPMDMPQSSPRKPVSVPSYA